MDIKEILNRKVKNAQANVQPLSRTSPGIRKCIVGPFKVNEEDDKLIPSREYTEKSAFLGVDINNMSDSTYDIAFLEVDDKGNYISELNIRQWIIPKDEKADNMDYWAAKLTLVGDILEAGGQDRIEITDIPLIGEDDTDEKFSITDYLAKQNHSTEEALLEEFEEICVKLFTQDNADYLASSIKAHLLENFKPVDDKGNPIVFWVKFVVNKAGYTQLPYAGKAVSSAKEELHMTPQELSEINKMTAARESIAKQEEQKGSSAKDKTDILLSNLG